ncbi:hypothetical protein SAMN05661096_00653 [Marivirga sericea]|uniref:Uncharacterized protein n=1 Tax=Marivirga sericea TaxID=1028 RepID=A0A1X7IH71_9BACT|nr:hypothetical protein [Marivirga sericea]SMG14185.1 hypothetical protein SAMN05661096_00653 [Marivirga sericea]
MKFLKSSLLFVTILLFSFNTVVDHVYICDSKNAKKYHYKKDYRGLIACKAAVVKVTLADAKDSKRTLCGWED